MVVSKDIATAEVEKWLDFKRKSESNREKNKDSIDNLIDAICEGDIVLNEDNTITQNLRFPVKDSEGKDILKKLDYKARLKAETLQQHCQGVKTGDADGRVNAHIAALTSNSKGMIGKMDVDDYGIASVIVTVFFG